MKGGKEGGVLQGILTIAAASGNPPLPGLEGVPPEPVESQQSKKDEEPVRQQPLVLQEPLPTIEVISNNNG